MGNNFHVTGLYNTINNLYNYPCLTVLFVVTNILESKKFTHFFFLFVSSHPKWDEECLPNELIHWVQAVDSTPQLER